eukprot:NODE_80_length_22759_cov_1.466858.p1 type:complete len:1057 gc:universal NODE_80_length_22759_cov_1.466858:12052-15222(+)
MDLAHDRCLLLISSICNRSNIEIEFFENLFSFQSHSNLEQTLFNVGALLTNQFKVFEVVKHQQIWTNYSLEEVLREASKDHFHRLGDVASAHSESLLVHSVGCMLLSTNCSLQEGYENPVLIAICSLFHDIGKMGTIQTTGNPKNPVVAFYFHAEMGAGIISFCFSENEWVSFAQWQDMTLAINFHMCTYHSHNHDLKHKHQLAVKDLLGDEVRKILYFLSIGDMSSRFPRQNISKWLETRQLILNDHSSHSSEYFSKYSGNGILIQLLGMSASGKSYARSKIIEQLNILGIDFENIVIVERDNYVCKIAAAFAGISFDDQGKTPSGNLYRELHEIYKTNKLGDQVNKRMKNDIQIGLMENKIVILDTVAVLFEAAKFIIPDSASIALRINIFVIRDQFMTEPDAQRLGLSLKDQVSIHGDRSLLFWLPSDFKKRYSKGLLRRRQMAGNFYGSSGVSKALISSDSPILNFVIKWGFEFNLLPFYKVIKMVYFSTKKVENIFDFEQDLTELINKVEKSFGFEFLKEFFNGLNFLFLQPFKSKSMEKDVVIIKYKDNCMFWKAKWARQARGAAFVRISNSWFCIKSLLQRGAEVLTGIHVKDGLTDSQDYHLGKCSHFDTNQQDTILRFLNGSEIDGLLSSKVDGSLLGISIIPKTHKAYEFAKKLYKSFQIASHNHVLNFAEKYLDFIPLFYSQGTIMFGEFMEDWYFCAFLVGVCRVSPLYLEECFSKQYSIEKLVLENIEKICLSLKEFVSLNQEKIKEDICCLSFESVCPMRKSIWGPSHTELALSYDEYHCKFLGCTFGVGATCGQFEPHLEVTLPAKWSQPTIWQIKEASQVSSMIKDVELVIHEDMSINSFFEKYPPIHSDDQILDFEGFVFFRKHSDHYDYSKIKTLVYYNAHKPKKSTIESLMKISSKMAKFIPSVLILKQYFENVDKSLIAFNNDIYELLVKNNEMLIKEMKPKAQESYYRQNKDTQIKMLMNNCALFLVKLKEIFCMHFENSEFVDPLFLKTLCMKLCVWEEDSQTVSRLVQEQNQIIFDLWITILDSLGKQPNNAS